MTRMTLGRITTLMAAAVASSAIVSCGEVDPVAGSFTLSGAVTDSRLAGLAVPGVTVRLDNGTTASATTDSLGRYRFADIGGKVKVIVTAPPGYREATMEVTVRSDQTLDIGLDHTGIPPFSGTIWVTPDILGPDDPSSLGSVTHTGRGMRRIFDRRTDEWTTVNAYLFDVEFGERTVEWQFNPEFGSVEAAQAEIDVFAPAIGRLPTVLLEDLDEVEVNAGQGLFGGDPYERSFLIHTEDPGTLRAVRDGFLEEVFLHEGAHVSLDLEHYDSPGWRAAQQADGVAISEYASGLPDQEDVAETILPWFAVRYRPERLTVAVRWLMTMTTPNRLAYLDEQEFDMSPHSIEASASGDRCATPERRRE